MANFGDYQLGIYRRGLEGSLPEEAFTFEQLRQDARGALSESLFSYTDGGCGDEATQRANVEAFGRYGITPRMMRATTDRDLSIELLGMNFPSPLFLSPIGVTGILDRDNEGEVAVGRACAQLGVPMCVSTLTQTTLEDVVPSLGETPGFFQLYTPNDRDLAISFIQRAEQAGYKALIVTLDTWTPGWRPRDVSFANFPQLRGWCLTNYFTDPRFIELLGKDPYQNMSEACQLFGRVFGLPIVWDDLSWIREATTLPIVLKGICHPDDARQAVDSGVDGIYCSNHGGRQANGGRAALDMLPAVIDASGDTPVMFDSGIRTGTDVVKALAMGATAVGIGRPYAFGLAVGGTEGVKHVVRSILAEADLYMAVDGYPTRAHLTRDILHRLPPPGPID